jgi:hypothetical protein
MIIYQSPSPLEWGELDLPLLGITKDWDEKALNSPFAFSVACDSENLWFLAARQSSGTPHPNAKSGEFFEGLWEYDVAELFIADPKSGSYLEINLAPNGAHWAAMFDAPRVRSHLQPDFKNIITSYWESDWQDSWLCALSIPLDELRKIIPFDAQGSGNVTAILNHPQQSFHSVAKLPGKVPDYHQPSAFTRLEFREQIG